MKFEKLKGDHTSDKYWWFDFFPDGKWRLHWMKINVLFLFCFQPSLVQPRLSKRMLHEIYVLDFNFNIYLVLEGRLNPSSPASWVTNLTTHSYLACTTECYTYFTSRNNFRDVKAMEKVFTAPKHLSSISNDGSTTRTQSGMGKSFL